MLDVNVKGVVYGMKHALAVMRPQGSGVIVNVASVQGFRVVYAGRAFYAASKAAVVSLTKVAALEHGDSRHPRRRHRAGTDRHADAAQRRATSGRPRSST